MPNRRPKAEILLRNQFLSKARDSSYIKENCLQNLPNSGDRYKREAEKYRQELEKHLSNMTGSFKSQNNIPSSPPLSQNNIPSSPRLNQLPQTNNQTSQNNIPSSPHQPQKLYKQWLNEGSSEDEVLND